MDGNVGGREKKYLSTFIFGRLNSYNNGLFRPTGSCLLQLKASIKADNKRLILQILLQKRKLFSSKFLFVLYDKTDLKGQPQTNLSIFYLFLLN